MRTFIGRSLLLWLTVVLCFAPVAEAGPAAPLVQAKRQRDVVRLTFEWGQPTLLKAKTKGKEVILTFNRKLNPDMRRLVKQMQPYVTKAERKRDGKTIVLTLDKPRRIRSFANDRVSGIDVLDVRGGTADARVAQKKAPKTTEKKRAQVTPPHAPSAAALAALQPAAGSENAPPQDASSPVAADAPVPVTEVPPATTTPAAKEEKASGTATEAGTADSTSSSATSAEPSAPLPSHGAEEKPGAASARISSSGVSMAPMSTDQNEETVQSTEKKKEASKKDAESAAAPVVPVEASQEEGVVPLQQENKVVVSADPEGATLRFPLKERTAFAVFIRESMLWVVLDRKMDMDLSDFDEVKQSVISKGTILDHQKATILRIPISDNIYPIIKQQEGKFEFAVLLSANKTVPAAALEVTVNTEPPVPPHVFLPVLEMGNVFDVEDPNIGDHLLIAPVYTREQGIAVRRNFVEFSLLPSTQGVVVQKRSNLAEITALRNGIRVGLPKGAHLSPQLSKEQTKNLEAVAIPTVGTLFPDDLWALEPGKSYPVVMRKLFNQTVFASSEGEKNLARLRMAQLYLRQGFVVEAIGMLDLINRSNPSYYRSAKLAAMRGAANFLLYRFKDAARDFGGAELNNNPEVAYWRDMLADLLGSTGKSYDFLAMNKNYISKYPPVFRQRLSVVAADRLIAAKDYNSALKIFDFLSHDNIIQPIQSYVDFLTAKISFETGKEQEAMEVWKRLAADDKDKFVQARAEFSTILWDLDNNAITREDAINKLERLRLRWHGDGLELQVVHMLGDLYADKQDYVNAMRVWQIGVTGFRNTGPAVEMAQRMETTFAKIFSEGIVDKMTPLEALALYYEYRNYSPAGVTTQVIERLADRLAGVDLLTSAAELLDQHMRTQMEKAERSRVGAKLASVYLANNQPKKALRALQDSVYGDNPILQRIQRNQLTAEALAQLGKPEDALAVLGQDESALAEKTRAMIYWRKQDWANVASAVENMFKKRPDPALPLNEEEGEFALRLALAYRLQQDEEQLQYMRDYFGPLMRGNHSKSAFDFITTSDMTVTTRNFEDLLDMLSQTRGFVTRYKARVDTATAG